MDTEESFKLFSERIVRQHEAKKELQAQLTKTIAKLARCEKSNADLKKKLADSKEHIRYLKEDRSEWIERCDGWIDKAKELEAILKAR